MDSNNVNNISKLGLPLPVHYGPTSSAQRGLNKNQLLGAHESIKTGGVFYMEKE
jgi:hypothetical protein